MQTFRNYAISNFQLSEDLNRTLIIQTKDHNDNENDKELVEFIPFAEIFHVDFKVSPLHAFDERVYPALFLVS